MFDDRAKARAAVCVCNSKKTIFRWKSPLPRWKVSQSRSQFSAKVCSARISPRFDRAPVVSRGAHPHLPRPSSLRLQRARRARTKLWQFRWPANLCNQAKVFPEIFGKFHWKKDKTRKSQVSWATKLKIINRRKRLAEIWCLNCICEILFAFMRPQTSRFTFPCHFYSRELTPRRFCCVIFVRILPRQVIDNVGHFLYLAYITCFLHALAKNRALFSCAEKDFFWRGWRSVKTRSISRESLTTESHTVSVPTSSGGVENLHWKVIRGVLSRSGLIFALSRVKTTTRLPPRVGRVWVMNGICLFISQSWPKIANHRATIDWDIEMTSLLLPWHVGRCYFHARRHKKRKTADWPRNWYRRSALAGEIYGSFESLINPANKNIVFRIFLLTQSCLTSFDWSLTSSLFLSYRYGVSRRRQSHL